MIEWQLFHVGSDGVAFFLNEGVIDGRSITAEMAADHFLRYGFSPGQSNVGDVYIEEPFILLISGVFKKNQEVF